MILEARARKELESYAQKLWVRGWVANHDGNISARVGPDRFVCTPSATSKADVVEGQLVVVNSAGKQLQGKGKPFGELPMHLAVYKARADANAVVHAHPPYATALGVTARELVCFLPESVVSLGARIPVAPLAIPGAGSVGSLQPFLEWNDAVMVAGNGVWAWGETVEQAYLRVELVEHLATIAHHAQAWGGAQPLPPPIVEQLLEARKKYFPRYAAAPK